MRNILLITPMIFFLSLAHAEVKTELTDSLDGIGLTYTFSGGNAYNIKFSSKSLSYRFVSGSKPDKLWGPYPYKAMKTEKGEYFVAWFEDGYYATILFDPKTKHLYGSSISGKNTYFEKAEISQIK